MISNVNWSIICIWLLTTLSILILNLWFTEQIQKNIVVVDVVDVGAVSQTVDQHHNNMDQLSWLYIIVSSIILK